MIKRRAKTAQAGGGNEGEGSRTAARRYGAGVEKTVRRGNVERKAREAARALDGAEGPALRKAEYEAKHAMDKK